MTSNSDTALDLLREARDALDGVATMTGSPRWDLAIRIAAFLERPKEARGPRGPTSVYLDHLVNRCHPLEGCDCTACENRRKAIEQAKAVDFGPIFGDFPRQPVEPLRLPFGMSVPAPGTKCDHGVLLEHECEACNSSKKAASNEPEGPCLFDRLVGNPLDMLNTKACDHDFTFTENKDYGWCVKCKTEYDYAKHGIV